MKKTVLIFVTCILALFTACEHSTNPCDDSQPAESFGKVSVSINGVWMKQSPEARTVIPSLTDDPFKDFTMVYEFAEVTVDEDGDEDVSDTWTVMTADEDGLFTLKEGGWRVKVSAYAGEDADVDSDDPVANGISETFTASVRDIGYVNVKLTEDAGKFNGTGTFSYHIKYTDGADVAAFSLKKMFDGVDEDPTIIDLRRESGTSDGEFVTLIGSVPDVPAGYYFLTVSLTKDNDWAGANEAVYIYNSMTSEYGTADEPVVFEFIYFSDYVPSSPNGVTYYVEEVGGEDHTKKTTHIKFTFAAPVSGLTANHVIVTYGHGVAEGEVTTGDVTSENGTTSDTVWYLEITDVIIPGYIYVRINKRNIEEEQKLVAVVYHDWIPAPKITVDAVYAQRGVLYPNTPMDNLKNTLMVKLLYDGLSPQMLSRSEYSLSHPNFPYDLAVGAVTVTVNAQGFLGYFTPIIAARYTATTIEGMPNNSTTTGITLKFETDIDALGLTADDITVTIVAGDVTTGTPTRVNSTEWTVPVTAVTSGNITVAITKKIGVLPVIETTVKPVAVVKEPDRWGISLSRSGTTINNNSTVSLPAATYGYGAQSAQTFTITNTGNQPSENLTVALGGTNASYFTLSTTSINSIIGGSTGSFTVTPTTTGLAVGTYTATVSLTNNESGNKSITANFTVSFAVNRASVSISAPTASSRGENSITLNTVSVSSGQTVQYARNTSNSAPTSASSWQSGTTFSGLTASTTYYFFARAVENTNYNTVTSSGSAISTTAPDLIGTWRTTISGSTVYLTFNANGTWSMSGGNTSSGNYTFDGTTVRFTSGGTATGTITNGILTMGGYTYTKQ